MDLPPKTEAVIHIKKQDIGLITCEHLTSNNVKKDLTLYKIIDELGNPKYFGTCSLCYMMNVSRKHMGKNDD